MASRRASFTARMLVIWLPMWKCRSCRQSSMSSPRSTSTSPTICRVVSPNFDRTPPDCIQSPEPCPHSLVRIPMMGRIPNRRELARMVSSSLVFSMTRMGRMPSLPDSRAVSMKSSSL